MAEEEAGGGATEDDEGVGGLTDPLLKGLSVSGQSR